MAPLLSLTRVRSVQDDIYTPLEKPITCAPPHLSDVSPNALLKQFEITVTAIEITVETIKASRW